MNIKSIHRCCVYKCTERTDSLYKAVKQEGWVSTPRGQYCCQHAIEREERKQRNNSTYSEG